MPVAHGQHQSFTSARLGKSSLLLTSFSHVHHLILLLIKPAVISAGGCSLEHGTATPVCLSVCFPSGRSRNVPSVFFCDSLDVPGVAWMLTTKSQFRGPPNLSCFSPAFFSSSPRLMEDNKACMKIVSVFIGSHSEDGKRISVARQRVAADCFCGSGHLPLPCPNGNC